jgi:hypothetical protein
MNECRTAGDEGNVRSLVAGGFCQKCCDGQNDCIGRTTVTSRPWISTLAASV